MTARYPAVGLVLVLGATRATAQSPFPWLWRATEVAKRRQPATPLEPAGNPGLLPKEANRLPEAGEPDRGFRVVRSGDVHFIGEETHVTGGGELLIRGYRVFADTARGNRRTEVWELDGNVKIIGKDAVITGRRVIVDFQNETFRAFESESQLDPEFLGTRQIRDKIYVDGRESFGTARNLRSIDGELSTCNYDHPHYELVGQNTEVRVGRRAILRNARFRLFDRTLFNLPFLVIPLNQTNYKYTPDVGQSPDEGYYIKNNYGVPIRGDRFLATRFDYMSKLGTGTGVGYNYGGSTSNGEARVYQITGKANTFNFNNRHQQSIGRSRLTLENDLQRNNYLAAPGSSLLQNRVQLDVPWARGSSQFSLNRNNNESSNYSTTNQTLSLADDRQLGSGLRTRLGVNHVSTSQSFLGGSSPKREQMDVAFRADQEVRVATASLDYQRSIPIGDGQNAFVGQDRTPVVTLSSDARRLFGASAERTLPFRTELSLGEFGSQAATGGHITRSAFDFNFQKFDRSQQRFRADFTGQFRQGLYSDDTAQYVLNYGTNFSYRTSRDTAVNLRYNYLRPYGYTPLTIDRTGKTNLVTVDASARMVRTWRLGVQTGYDINRLDNRDIAWQQVGVRSEWEPRDWFLLRALTTYDTYQQQWSSVRLDLGYRPGATFLGIGARYDGIRQVWGSVNVLLQNLKVGRTNLSAVLQYNGYTKQFDSRQYSLIYDLHCAEAIFNVQENNVGFRAGREIQFLIRLKAFPFGTNFGTGRRGQPFGTGTGRDF